MTTFAKTIQRTICSKPINPCSLEFQPWSLLIDNQYLNAIRPFPFLFLNPRPFLFLRFVPSVQLVPTKLPSFLFPPGHTATFFPRSEGEKRSFVVACTKDLFAADATRADNINVGNTEGKEKAREKERERERGSGTDREGTSLIRFVSRYDVLMSLTSDFRDTRRIVCLRGRLSLSLRRRR